ncbi:MULTISPECIES: hypothetical protein [Lysobacteraceae]|nr:MULTISPECIES: hypothetical protein [Lysobacter]
MLTDSASGEGLPTLLRADYHLADPGNALHPFQPDQQFVPAIVLPTALVAPADDFDGLARPDGSGRYLYGAFGR